jgi:hypothetical protein
MEVFTIHGVLPFHIHVRNHTLSRSARKYTKPSCSETLMISMSNSLVHSLNNKSWLKQLSYNILFSKDQMCSGESNLLLGKKVICTHRSVTNLSHKSCHTLPFLGHPRCHLCTNVAQRMSKGAQSCWYSKW